MMNTKDNMMLDRRFEPPEQYQEISWHWVRNHLGLTVARWMPKIKDGIWEYSGFQARATDSRLCDNWRYIAPIFPPVETGQVEAPVQAAVEAKPEVKAVSTKAKVEAPAAAKETVGKAENIVVEAKPEVSGLDVFAHDTNALLDDFTMATVSASMNGATEEKSVPASPVVHNEKPKTVDHTSKPKQTKHDSSYPGTPDAVAGQLWASSHMAAERRLVKLVERSEDHRLANRRVHYVPMNHLGEEGQKVVVTMERWKAWARRIRAVPVKIHKENAEIKTPEQILREMGADITPL